MAFKVVATPFGRRIETEFLYEHEALRPLGITIVGGLLVSQILTLYVTPVFYTYMDTFQAKLGRFKIFRRRESGSPLPSGQSPEEQLAPGSD